MSDKDNLKSKSLVKITTAIAKFNPKVKKELISRGLDALAGEKDAEYYFLKGEEYRQEDRYKEAVSCYNKAISLDQNHENALFFLGYCYLDDSINEYSKAVLVYEKLIEISEDDSLINPGIYNLGIAYYNLKKYEKAIENFELIMFEYDPYRLLGHCYYELENYEEAIESYKQAIELSPDDGNAYHYLGYCQYKLENYIDAIEIFEKTIELNPEDGNAYHYLGYCQYKLENYIDAIEIFEKAIELQYDLPVAYYWLGYTHYALENYEEALENFEQAIKLNPNDGNVYQWLVKSLLKFINYNDNYIKWLSTEKLLKDKAHHDSLYYVITSPEISDNEYDRLVEELKKRRSKEYKRLQPTQKEKNILSKIFINIEIYFRLNPDGDIELKRIAEQIKEIVIIKS